MTPGAPSKMPASAEVDGTSAVSPVAAVLKVVPQVAVPPVPGAVLISHQMFAARTAVGVTQKQAAATNRGTKYQRLCFDRTEGRYVQNAEQERVRTHGP